MAPVQASAALVRPEGPTWVRWGLLSAVCLVYVALTMDFIATAVASPAIQRPPAEGGLGASFPQLEWALEAFVVAVAALVPVSGYLADILGRPLVLLAGTWVFAFTSLSASLSSSPYVLIASRAGQGVGAALVLATAPLLLTEVFGPRDNRTALAVWGTAIALAVAASPAVGGAVTEALGWRWIFGLEAGAAGLAFAGAQATAGRYLTSAVPELGEPPDGQGRGGDWKGVGLFTAAVAIAVVGLVRTTSTPGEWAESGVLACFACSALLFGSFVAVESVAPAPVLNMSLFRARSFSAASVAALGLSGAVLGPLFLLVLYLSYDLAEPPLKTGLALVVLTGMTVPVLAVGGWLERWLQPKWLICGGLLFVSLGFWLLSRSLGSAGPRGASLGALAPGLAVAGAGLELVSPRLASAAASAVKPSLAAQASRASSTFRHLGTAMGLAVAGSVFVSRLTSELSRSVSLPEGPPTASLVLQGKLAQAARAVSPGQAAGLAAVHEGSAYALRGVFIVASLVALGAALASLLVRAADLAGLGEQKPPLAPAPARAAPEVATAAAATLLSTAASARAASSVARALARSPARCHASLLSPRDSQVTKLASLRSPASSTALLGHVYGAVKSHEGAWLPEVKVVLRDALGSSVALTESDSAGSYHFSDVPAGRYTLAALQACNSSPGGAEMEVEVAAGKATAADLCVTAPGKLVPGKGPSLLGSWKVPARDAWAPQARRSGS